jgi:hypothetical protein
MRFAIDQEQIGLEVAFAMVLPFVAKRVIVIFWGQRPVLGQ